MFQMPVARFQRAITSMRAQRRTANGKISGRAGGRRKAARAEGSLAVWGAKQWAYGRVGGERMQACVRAKLHILALANEFILHLFMHSFNAFCSEY